MKRIVLGTLLTIIALAGGISAWFFVALSPLCGNEIVQDVRSPDGRHRAMLFQRDCGATTGFSTHVSIVGVSKDLADDSGNVLVADGAPRDGSWKIRGHDAGTLTVTVDPYVEFRPVEANVEGITIRYEL